MARDLSVQSRITAKYQVTIPRQVRERLTLQVADAIEWSESADGRIYVAPYIEGAADLSLAL